MNSIITLNRLSELVARACGVKIAEAEAYLKAFMETAKLALGQDGFLAVKGIGIFKVEEENGERKVVFQPDNDLAENVNGPFAMFTPEELAPGASIENLDIDIAIDDPDFMETETPDESEPSESSDKSGEIESSEDLASSHEVSEDSATPAQPEPEPLTKYTEVNEGSEETELRANLAAAYGNNSSQTDHAEEDYTDEYENEYYDDEYDDSHKKFPVFWTAWALVIGLLVGLAIGFFAHDPICELLEPTVLEQEEEIYFEEEESATSEIPSDTNQDAVQEPVEETPAPAQTSTVSDTSTDVYDTITERTFLTHLAQKHYHQKDYWVYIYLENQDIIGNPNTVKAGTRVKIPPLSKYAKHASDAENLREAKALAAKILNK